MDPILEPSLIQSGLPHLGANPGCLPDGDAQISSLTWLPQLAPRWVNTCWLQDWVTKELLPDGVSQIGSKKGEAYWLPGGVPQIGSELVYLWGPPSGCQSVVPHFGTNLGNHHFRANLGSPSGSQSGAAFFLGTNMGCLFQFGSQSRVPHLGTILGCSIWEPIGEPIWGTPI